MLLFLNHSIDFPAFYQTFVCLSCMASILFLSRNSCYSSTVHIALISYICPQAQVCEHRYNLWVTRCRHTATSKCWNCFCEVVDILGCWLSLAFLKALQYFCKENYKELHRLQRKSEQKMTRTRVWFGISQCCSIPFPINGDRTFFKSQIPNPQNLLTGYQGASKFQFNWLVSS